MTFSFPRSLLAASLGLSLAFSAANAAEPHKQVLADAEQYQPEALKMLERLVNIDSGSGYEPGLKQVSDIAIDELKKLGATIELVPNTPEKSNHVLATRKAGGNRIVQSAVPGRLVRGHVISRQMPMLSQSSC